jgi:MoaA/NifB/PqqE/SkfB family radical SAM enzyme
VQINSTIAKHNVAELPALLDLALALRRDALHLFMLVPVGCGLEIAPAEMLPADEYERVLHWFDDRSKDCPIDLKATCAPHYYRIRAQRLARERKRGDTPGPSSPRHARQGARRVSAARAWTGIRTASTCRR